MGDLTRRDFIGLAGAAAAGTVTGCWAYPGPAPVEPVPLGWDRGERRTLASTCGQCPAACGIRVHLVDGRAYGIAGDPDHPVNKGGLGPKGQSGLQLLYHPDRIHGPLQREGVRGEGRWKPVAWDVAIQEIAGRLGALRKLKTPQSLVVLDGEPRGTMREFWDRFLVAFGSPNHIDHRGAHDGANLLAMGLMQGVPDVPACDWGRVRHVLGFGAGIFESGCQTIHLMRSIGQLRQGLPGRRAKLVLVSSRLSVSTAKADEWVAIEPGTDGALALGLAHVLIKDGLHDEAFIGKHASGFDDWKDEEGREHLGFRRHVLEGYAPEKVAKITGVEAADIRRMAHELHEYGPSVVLADPATGASTNGLGTAMAIHALNALLGRLERPGGLRVQRRAPLAAWKEVAVDPVARTGRKAPRVDGAGSRNCPLGGSHILGLPEAILSKQPYPVEALFLYRSNPIYSKPGGRRWAEALAGVPLVVSFSPFQDESTHLADYVLPDHTFLERWDLVEPAPGAGYPVLGLRQPVVEPLHDTLATGDVVLNLAKALDGPVRDAFPWKDYRAATVERLAGVQKAGTGSITDRKLEGFLDQLEKAGAWWDTTTAYERWDEAFLTPSGKFEFYARAAATKVATLFPDQGALEAHLAARGVATRGDALFLPHWEPPRYAGDPGAYPFVLEPYRGIEYTEGGARHLPWLRELPSAGIRAWEERIELNPADAEPLGIHEGDRVQVETPAGKRHLCARILPGVRPGTAGLPLGHGPWPPDPKAEGETGGGYGLLVPATAPLAGIVAVLGTRARIRKEKEA